MTLAARSRRINHGLSLAIAIAIPIFATPTLAAPPPSSSGSARPAAKSGGSAYDEEPPAKADDSIYDDPGDPTERARKLFKTGMAAADKGLWPEAFNAFTAAWVLKRHWQIAYQLAKVEIRTDRIRSAIQHLNTVRADADEKAQLIRTEVLALLEEARTKLAQLQVSGSPAGASVMVDGELRGTLPLAGPLEVDPGTHEVELRLGDATSMKKVVASSGQSTTINVELKLARGEPPLVSASPEPSYVPVILGVGGLALGLAGAVTGAGLWVAADKSSSANNSANSQRAGAVGAWAAGGVFLVGGAFYAVYSQRQQPSSPPTVSLVPIIAPGHLGILATGAW